MFVLLLCSVSGLRAQTARLDSVDISTLPGIREVWEEGNAAYAAPQPADRRLLRFLKPQELHISPEAYYWAHLVRDASTRFSDNMTFRDTIIVNPLFMPIIFKGDNVLPKKLDLYHKPSFGPSFAMPDWYRPDTAVFRNALFRQALVDSARFYVQTNYPEYIRYNVNELPKDKIRVAPMRHHIYEDVSLKVKPNVQAADEVKPPAKFIPDRLYWTSSFQSAVQFSQNYVSPNWYKGGSSNLNILTQNTLDYDYNKGPVQWTNEFQLKASIYNAPNDTVNNYKIGDDLFLLHSNMGYKAFSKWYYTFDAEFKTQLFTNYQENTSIKQAALLSPYTFNIGVGMKYDLTKNFKPELLHRKWAMTINLAPISYTYMQSLDTHIDLGRYGFNMDQATGKYKSVLNRFGSTIRLNSKLDANRSVSWQSNFFYFTTYNMVQMEFENTLNLAISRFFSTRVYFDLRYDDSAARNPDFNSYFQLNEIISLGFNYKW
jgi:hypothetical protein